MTEARADGPLPDGARGGVDAARFKAAFRHHAAGVAVVTAEGEDGPLALTASSVTSVSAEPPVLLFSVATGTGTGRALASVPRAAVHLLDAGDHALALRCADPTAERFADPSDWERLPTGEPVFLGPRLVLAGAVRERIATGEATVVLIDVDTVVDRRPEGPEDGPEDAPGPLAYHDRRWHVLGPSSRIG